MFSCDVCDAQFKQPTNLCRHKKVAHFNDGPDQTCRICDKKFFRKDNLIRHLRLAHKIKDVKQVIDQKPVREKAFTCGQCDKAFTSRKNLTRHERIAHASSVPSTNLSDSTRPAPKPPRSTNGNSRSISTKLKTPQDEQQCMFKCKHCPGQYKFQNSLNRHLRKAHDEKIGENERVRRTLACGMCDYRGADYTKLTCHMTNFHSYDDETECKDFGTMQEFEAWKECVQGEQLVRFVNGRGVRQRAEGKKYLFECHRSGIIKRHGRGIRRLKVSCKVGAVCPARMIVLLRNDGSVAMTWHKNHLGHELDIKFLRLKKTEAEKNLEKTEKKKRVKKTEKEKRVKKTERKTRVKKIEKEKIGTQLENHESDDSIQNDDAVCTDYMDLDESNRRENGGVPQGLEVVCAYNDNCDIGRVVQSNDVWGPVCSNLKSCLDSLSGVTVSDNIINHGLAFLELLRTELQGNSSQSSFPPPSPALHFTHHPSPALVFTPHSSLALPFTPHPSFYSS